jgi:hypothetical protein
MARPRKTNSDKLTDKINVATTPATKARAEAAAKELDLSLSALMNLALVQYLDPEKHGKNRRSYRRAEVVDSLGRAAVAMEDIVLIGRGIGPQERAVELFAGLLRVERLLAAVAMGAGRVDEDAPDLDGDPK